MSRTTFLGCRLLIVGDESPIEGDKDHLMVEVDCGRGDHPCLLPGEPCPCKDDEDLLEEWLKAFDERMAKARTFLGVRVLKPEGHLPGVKR
jgi:hypothetical protein